jgi:hypothetical protein
MASSSDEETATLSEKTSKEIERRMAIVDLQWQNRFDDLQAELGRLRVERNLNDDRRRNRETAPSPRQPENASRDFKIAILKDHNFLTWSTDVEICLKEEKLWNILTKEKKYAGYPEERDYTEDEKDRVFRILYQSCDEERKRIIADTRDPTIAWEKLRDIFEPRNMICKIESIRNFFGVKMKHEERMIDYVNRIKQLYRDFTNAGNKAIDDELVANVMIMGLPKEYAAVKSIANALEGKNLCSKRVEELLMAEFHQRRLEYEENESSDEERKAMVARNEWKRKEARKTKDTRKCFNCGQVGHVQRFCKKPKREEIGPESQTNRNESIKDERWKKGKYVNTASCLRSTRDNRKEEYDTWILDSGSSNHISDRIEDFKDLEEISDEIVWGDNNACDVKGKGTIECFIKNGKGNFGIRLKDVLYVPNFGLRVMSIGSAAKHGWDFSVNEKQIVGKVNERTVLWAKRNEDNLYRFQIIMPHNGGEKKEVKPLIKKNLKTGRRSTEEAAKLWHERMGHLSWESLETMQRKGMVRGLPENLKRKKDEVCDVCREMKSTRLPFQERKVKRANGLLDVIHSDVCGPISPKSLGGNRYFVSFTDDHSRKSDIFFLKKKNEVFEKFKAYKVRSEKATGKKIKILRTDNGTEYLNERFEKFLRDEGIKHERTQIYSPEQNGISERLNRTLTEKARCMLRQANLPEKFWGEAIRMANHLKNHSPSKCCGEKVPMEWWGQRVPSIVYFKKFGCAGFVNIPKPKRKGKFGRRGKKMIFVGYPEDSKGYRFWDTEENKIVTSRDVYFNEADFGWNLTKEDKDSSDEDREEARAIFAFKGRKESRVTEEESADEQIQEITGDSEDQESEVEEIESEVEQEVAVRVPEAQTSRELRVRTEKVKPVKYSAVLKKKEADVQKLENTLDTEEEEEDLQVRSGKSKKKYEKKKRRLERVKARKTEIVNSNPNPMKSNPVVTEHQEGNTYSIDPFTKYAPNFDD